MAHCDKPAGIRADLIRKTSVTTYSPVSRLSGKIWRSPIREKINLGVEAGQRWKTKCTSQSLVEETICDVSGTGCCAATKTSRNQPLLESAVTEKTYSGTQDEKLSQCFSRWSRSDFIMQVLDEKVVSGPELRVPVAGFLGNA